MNLGENIKKYRKEKGMTQEELAQKCGLSKNGLWNYENNKRQPNIKTLNKIIDALGIKITDLIDNTISLDERKKFTVNYVKEMTENTLETITKQSKETEEIVKKSKELIDKYTKLENEFDFMVNTSTGLLGAIIYFINVTYPNKKIDYVRIADDNKENTINIKEADEIIKKVCDLVEFELYKISSNKE